MKGRARSLALIASSTLLAALLGGCGEAGEVGEGGEPVLSTAEQALRPDSPGNNEIYQFDPNDVVETYGSQGGSFLIHFTRMGANAVPAADLDASGVPDFVEEVGAIYDEVTGLYQGELGFRPPLDDETLAVDNGGDARFDVYLVDFNGIGDGVYRPDGCMPGKPDICSGYMVQENDYKGYGYPSTTIANRILGSHEFFHAVQSAYDGAQDSVMREGSAVWATERFDPSLKDFEAFIDGYLENTDRTLNEPLPGPVDPFSYGAGLFFQFLSERFDDSMNRKLWERCEDGANGVADPEWLTELDPLLKAEAGSSFAEAFTDFAMWNLFTGPLADPARSYAAGSGYASVKMVDVKAPYSDDQLRVFRASSQYYRMPVDGRASMTAAVVQPADKPEEVMDLSLILAVQRGSSLDPVVRMKDAALGTETIDTKGADNFIVIIVNTTTAGSSRRPGFCAGTLEEIAACRNALSPPIELPDAGAPDGGADAGTQLPPEAEPGGCACDLGRPASPYSTAGSGALAAILGYALVRRRRARRPAR